MALESLEAVVEAGVLKQAGQRGEIRGQVVPDRVVGLVAKCLGNFEHCGTRNEPGTSLDMTHRQYRRVT